MLDRSNGIAITSFKYCENKQTEPSETQVTSLSALMVIKSKADIQCKSSNLDLLSLLVLLLLSDIL